MAMPLDFWAQLPLLEAILGVDGPDLPAEPLDRFVRAIYALPDPAGYREGTICTFHGFQFERLDAPEGPRWVARGVLPCDAPTRARNAPSDAA